jgi:hypothetical protein
MQKEADDFSIVLKRPEPEVDQSFKPSVEVKNKWSYNFNPTAHGQGQLLLASLKGMRQDARSTP